MSDELTYKFISSPKTIGLTGVAFSGGQPKAGVEEGPIRLVEFGLVDQLKELGWNVVLSPETDYTALRPNPDPDFGVCKNPGYVAAVTKRVRDEVKEHCENGRCAVTLGGDHSIALGTVSGSMSVYTDACLIWIDAHADLNTPLGSESGNLHGCPVSWLIGIAEEVPGFEWTKQMLTPDRLVYIGLRDVDEYEKKLLKKHKIKAFSMHDVDKYGIGKVVEMALDHVNPDRNRPIHLSFDVDALDPSVAPSTGTPVRGGLTFREGHFICEAIHETGLLVALDIVEVNPALGDDAALFQTVAVGCSLTRSAVGETLL